mmetsp:Transcript_11525/g.20406  ORF Transcript_11525/g.20406 Transcript_11525/m.20406 type:complete len:753 (+) Transcript_11525:169-2427(+)|eukprot:CAMPEP_0197632532 /NCGR_PEP_ID=MMETSP1338-20131121/9236_1 /TAXON_ID=43686 ORGANISM="Pelagodinium beii, Strain RCC1491" /NCGR_SAMPLE_ID=MMETSP1338 /ASSEMBLY_ACC=CAM_ASM_000754 /LENGTH=752 /DNA_ID=CAMNT_0043204095 /DNA_START=164 /DNA_END=2422 /DNA_ORIENTATION=-
MTLEVVQLVAKEQLQIGDVCSMLLARGLPSWMVEHLKVGLERSEAAGLNEKVLSSSSLSLTAEDLSLMGIAHPLHQRRLLRELECILSGHCITQQDVSQQAPAMGPGAGVKKRGAPKKHGRLPHVDNFRWPDQYKPKQGASPSPAPVSPRPESGEAITVLLPSSPKPTTLFMNHARRRWLKAAGVHLDAEDEGKPVEDLGLSEEVEAVLMEVGSLIHKKDINLQQREHFIPEITRKALPSEDMTELEEQEENPDMDETELGLPWEDFLQTRLHPWGPLVQVHEVLVVAKNGSLSALRAVIDKILFHGEDLTRSLSKAPLPREFVNAFPNAPKDTEAPKFIWSWVQWRLDLLETAKEQLNQLLTRADEFTLMILGEEKKHGKTHTSRGNSALKSPKRNARFDSPSPSPATSPSTEIMQKIKIQASSSQLGNLEATAPKKKKTVVLMPEEEEQVKEQVASVAPEQSVEKPKSVEKEQSGANKSIQAMRNRIMTSVPKARGIRLLEAAKAAGSTSGIELEGSKMTPLERFRRAGQQVQRHVRSRRTNGVVMNLALLRVISTQTKVKQLRSEMRDVLQQLERWPGVKSESREACEERFVRLKQVSQQLFDRFLELREPVHQELRDATTGDQGLVDTYELETAILDSQRELASQMLLGVKAIQAADAQGISLASKGMSMPPNPWEGETLHQSVPPWEVVFMRALKRLEPLKKQQLTKRRMGQASSLTANQIRLQLAASNSLSRMIDFDDDDDEEQEQ